MIWASGINENPLELQPDNWGIHEKFVAIFGRSMIKIELQIQIIIILVSLFYIGINLWISLWEGDIILGFLRIFFFGLHIVCIFLKK